MVLAILVNMGQITENIVARSIYYTRLDTANFQGSGTATLTGIYASNQGAAEGAGNGIKNEYRWGLYSYCGGATSGSDRACSSRSFGYEFQPLDVLESDATSQNSGAVASAAPTGTFSNSSYLGKFSKAANYLAFIGTVIIGVSFLVAFLAHRFAFLLASLLALLACACFFVAAAIWTAIIYKARHSIADSTSGLVLHYGNALWMEWAAAVAAFLSVIPLLIACISGRESKY